MSPICVSFQVLPGGLTNKTDVYAAVDAAIAVVARSGLRYLVGPMETTIEGDYHAIMTVIMDAQDAAIAAGAASVLTYIKVDYNPRGSSIDEKLEKYQETKSEHH